MRVPPRTSRPLGLLVAVSAVGFCGAEAAYQRGIAAYNRGDAASARREMEKAVATDPDYGDARGWLGFLLINLNQPVEALQHLERAVVLQPGVADHFTNLGNALLL